MLFLVQRMLTPIFISNLFFLLYIHVIGSYFSANV